MMMLMTTMVMMMMKLARVPKPSKDRHVTSFRGRAWPKLSSCFQDSAFSAMEGPSWLTPSAGRRAADCAASEVQEVARQVHWLSPLPGAASAAGHKQVPRAIRAAEAAAAAAEAAAQATMASQALLAAVQSQGASTPTKPRKRKEPRTTEKHSVGSAFSAEVVREKDAHPGEHNSDAAIAHDATRSAFPAEMVSEKDSHPGEEKSVTATAKEKGGHCQTGICSSWSQRDISGQAPSKEP